MKNKEFLVIYSDIIITTGAIKMILVDTSRNKVFELPKSFSNLINDLKNYPVTELRLKYDDKNFDSFVKFILDQDLGMMTPYPEMFPNVDQSFSSPEYINNSILEFYPSESYEKYGERIQKLDDLGCKFYEFRMHLPIEMTILESIFKRVVFNNLKSINILSLNSSKLEDENYLIILRKFPFIKSICVFGSPVEANIKEESLMEDQRLYYIKEALDNKNCGKVSLSNLFIRGTDQIVENISHNSCLHKKVAVDNDGNIKNCPSMQRCYGNIDKNDLLEIVDNTSFKKLWNLTKDKIDICKDCEFRYLCTDCRAYTDMSKFDEQGLDISKPLKCGYNPYSGEWAEWSTNPLKQHAIKYYGMQ
ncbi:grasp-with-spasm system SPASM domain peptide maturase [Chryseobacterium gleum]|uniref:grasp-with-spasm system SPASM domain peptide maturase n=1 Tax=Chryseobacterium gleum TaxID=250 RepID=UPI0031D077D8